MNFIKRRKWLLSGIAVILIVSLLGIKININHVVKDGNLTVGQSGVVITIGDSTYASGTVDYTCDGTDDDIQFQGALDALPANGGEIQVLTGNYDFANATTVTRAIPNVKITGIGQGSNFTCDGATAIFTAGGNGWTISNIKTDAGGLTMGATTLWSWENVTINATYYAYRTDDLTTGSSWNIPTGRNSDYTIAASDSSTISKAQADVVCDGTDDDVQIQAVINSLTTYNGKITLLSGNYNTTSSITISYASGRPTCDIEGYGATINYAGNSHAIILTSTFTPWLSTDSYFLPIKTIIKGIRIVGTAAGLSGIEVLNQTTYTFQDIFIQDFSTGAGFLLTTSGDKHSEGGMIINPRTLNCLYGIHTTGVSEDSTTIVGGLLAVTTTNGYGIAWESAQGAGSTVTGLTIWIEAHNSYGIYLNTWSPITFTGLKIESPGGYNNQGILTGAGYGDACVFVNPFFYGLLTNVVSTVPITKFVYGNYIAPGEISFSSGDLIAGNANAITFAWNNPFPQDILITKVVIEITTAGGTALSVIQVGLANDAAGTGLGSELFSGIGANSTSINDSWIAGDTGTQTKLFVCQDNVSATDDWIVGKILTQNAANLVGRYYIFYVGR